MHHYHLIMLIFTDGKALLYFPIFIIMDNLIHVSGSKLASTKQSLYIFIVLFLRF